MTGKMAETLQRLNPEVRGVLVSALREAMRKENVHEQNGQC